MHQARLQRRRKRRHGQSHHHHTSHRHRSHSRSRSPVRSGRVRRAEARIARCRDAVFHTTDLMEQVLHFLPAASVVAASAVCRAWRSSRRANSVWRRLYAARGWGWYPGMERTPVDSPGAWYSFYLERHTVLRLLQQPLAAVFASQGLLPTASTATATATTSTATATGTTAPARNQARLSTGSTFQYACRSITVVVRNSTAAGKHQATLIQARASYGAAAAAWSKAEASFLRASGWRCSRVWHAPAQAVASDGFSAWQSTKGFMAAMRRGPAGRMVTAGKLAHALRAGRAAVLHRQHQHHKQQQQQHHTGTKQGIEEEEQEGYARDRRRAATLRAVLGRDPLTLRDPADVAALEPTTPVSCDTEYTRTWCVPVDGSVVRLCATVIGHIVDTFVEAFGLGVHNLHQFRVVHHS